MSVSLEESGFRAVEILAFIDPECIAPSRSKAKKCDLDFYLCLRLRSGAAWQPADL